MLVVISDLHFGDGSATENIRARAFDLFLDHVVDLAEHAEEPRVTLLFLGDIFDLLRTEHWFYPAPGEPLDGPAPPEGEPFSLDDRPWASPEVLVNPRAISGACRDRALRIAEKIAAVCKAQLDILAGRPGDPPPEDRRALRARVAEKLARVTIDRIYLPGNHDRLALVEPRVMALFLSSLGARLPAPHELRAPGLLAFQGPAVVARHGHEYDGWNFEPARIGTETPASEDYLGTPLGDVLTTEVLARLPFAVRQRLLARYPGAPAWIDRVHAHLCGIEDVRPLGAVIRWVALAGTRLRHVPGAPADEVRALVDATARQVVFDLVRLRFTRAWRRRRPIFRAGFGTVVQLLAVWLLCKVLPLGWAEWLFTRGTVRSWLERRGDREQARWAERLLTNDEDGHAVLGHTHDARQIPVRPPGADVKVYLNSGTWRPRVYETLDQKGFRKVKEMTYLVFYEDRRQAYETWSGTKRP